LWKEQIFINFFSHFSFAIKKPYVLSNDTQTFCEMQNPEPEMISDVFSLKSSPVRTD